MANDMAKPIKPPVPPVVKPLCYCGNNPLPTAYTDSLSYEEEICRFRQKLIEVIQEVNGLNATVSQIIEWVDQMLEYYTIQQLQKWLDDGTLANLICNYLNIKITFDTTIEMIEKAKLSVGNKVSTLGYYNIGDGGQADFFITDNDNDENFSLTLNNGLYARLVINTDMNVKAFGCSPTNQNNGNLINKAISLCDIIHGNINEIYNVNNTINVTNYKTLYNLNIKINAVMQNALFITGRTNTLDNVKVDCNNLAQNGIIGSSASIEQTPNLTIIKNCRAENCSGNGYDTGFIRISWDNCYAVKCGTGFIVSTTDTEHGYLIAHDCLIGIKGYYATIIKSCHLWTVTTKQIGIYLPAYTRNFIVNNYFNDSNDIGIGFEKQAQAQIDNIILVNNMSATGCTDKNSRLLKFLGSSDDLTTLNMINIGSINGYFSNVPNYNELPKINNNRCVNVSQGSMIEQNQIGNMISNPFPFPISYNAYKPMLKISSNIFTDFSYNIIDVKAIGYERDFTILINFKTTSSITIPSNQDIFTLNLSEYFSSIIESSINLNLRTPISARITNNILYLFLETEKQAPTGTVIEFIVNIKAILK